ncbi:MAG TPA: sucrase ferredoxin [Pyrinomonadaceae bacterium]|nr:sucrase ferredoxin [Pyrinomonadaceae bacterium]
MSDQLAAFCSVRSIEAGENAFGTASIGDAWLLLEYPRPWGAKAFSESALPKAVKIHLASTLKQVPRSRVLLIKQSRKVKEPLTLFVVHSREASSSILKYEFSEYEQLLDLDLGLVLGGGSLVGATRWDGPLFLVCTHGKRDKCCAKFGIPVYKTIRTLVGDSAVWQCSHVGGDRFAANVVCFPDGLFYGHLTEETTKLIVREYYERRIVLANFRGRSCYSFPVQAAEFFARRETGFRGIGDLKFLTYNPLKPNEWRVRFFSEIDAKVHEVYLKSYLSEFQNRLTCHTGEPRSVVQYSLIDYEIHSESA